MAIVGCSTRTDDTKVVFTETTSDAMDLMTKPRGTFGLQGTPKAVWLDPRTEDDFAKEHIPGALSLPFPRLETEHAYALKDIDVVVVYDTDFNDALVKAVAKRLIALGHKDVYVLRGGLKSWKRDGNPVAAGAESKVTG